MQRKTFERHIERLYDSLLQIVETRYGDRGADTLHSAFVSILASKSHKRLPEHLGETRMTGWMVQSVIFTIRNVRKAEGLYRKRYKLISELEGKKAFWQKINRGFVTEGEMDAMAWEALTDEQTELKNDVRKAIGTLSQYHQGLIYAYYWEGLTYKELAKRTGGGYFRIFTELEIAKSCLRTELSDYKP